jgi:hypothetical protein
VFCLLKFLANVKEHATLSAGASADHWVEVKTTGYQVNRAADRGCCVSTCSILICNILVECSIACLLHLNECFQAFVP